MPAGSPSVCPVVAPLATRLIVETVIAADAVAVADIPAGIDPFSLAGHGPPPQRHRQGVRLQGGLSVPVARIASGSRTSGG